MGKKFTFNASAMWAERANRLPAELAWIRHFAALARKLLASEAEDGYRTFQREAGGDLRLGIGIPALLLFLQRMDTVA